MSKQIIALQEDSRKCIINAFGEDNWNRLSFDSQTGILTSEICLRSLNNVPANTDFSASIVPLMKVLEKELIDCFYLPYLSYLKVNYPNPADYITKNNLKGKTIDNRRPKIVFFDDKSKSLQYCSTKAGGKPHFTIGNYQFTVGVVKISKRSCDYTAIEFYKNTYFNSSSTSDVKNWICNLAKNLESIAKIRNNSAHAGYIQSITDADTALNVIIKIDRLLEQIISPSLP